jgi:hypothetical protein
MGVRGKCASLYDVWGQLDRSKRLRLMIMLVSLCIYLYQFDVREFDRLDDALIEKA